MTGCLTAAPNSYFEIFGDGPAARPGTNSGGIDVIEFGDTNTVFTNPNNKQTEDYITGRFG